MDNKDNTSSIDDIRDAREDGIEISKPDTDMDDEQSVEAAPSEGDTGRELSLQNLTEEEFQELLQSQRQLEEYRKRLEETSVRASEYEDLLKRKQAEFENFRKRAQKEAEDFKKYANREIVLDVLNVIDDFERAIQSTKSSKDFDTLLEGILLVEKQLRANLENKYGVKSIEAVGQKFDPTIHEAFMMEESENHDEDTVIEDLQKGYIMHERVIRPAKVKVAKAVSPNSKSNDSIEEE
jgi:molecular chaperone GrpE